MASREDLDTLKKIVLASGGRLSNGKLGRVHNGSAATGVDTLEEIAYTFGVEPWQLLDPRFVPPTEGRRALVAASVIPNMAKQRTPSEIKAG